MAGEHTHHQMPGLDGWTALLATGLHAAGYLSQAFGGPPLYSAGCGDETSMQRIHACNGEHVELDEACLKAFDLAVVDVGLTGEVAQRVSGYFRRATREQRQYGDPKTPVPDGLPFNFA